MSSVAKLVRFHDRGEAVNETVIACMLIILMHIVRDRNIKSTTKTVKNVVPK